MNEMINIEHLFRLHYSAMCMYSLHIVGDIDVAEDVVMNQFLKLSEILDRGNNIPAPKSYLYQMTRNASVDYLRAKKCAVFRDTLPDIVDDQDELIARSEREARLWKQIDKLPPACRKILIMSKCDDMKYQEIATTLGVSVKTVEAQIGKAYRLLREKVKEIYTYLFL